QLRVMREMAGATVLPVSGMEAVHFAWRQLLLLNIALPVAAVVSLIAGWWRRESAVLVPWAAFGSIIAFQVLAYERGQTASWLRYYIPAVPFVILCAATLLVDRRGELEPPSARRAQPLARVVLISIATVALGAAGLTSFNGILHD